MAQTGRTKRVPKQIAVIHADYCTGCEACVAVCPADCIRLIATDQRIKGIHAWCEVELERCIGCANCVHVPKRQSNPYALKICPWDAIDMVPTQCLPDAVNEIGGPPQYARENHERLENAARRLADRRASQ